MFKTFSLTTALMLLTGLSNPALAVDQLAVGLGYFNVLQQGHTNESAALMLEYRGDYIWNGLRPAIGITSTTHGGAYGTLGLYYDWNFYDRFYISPNFAVGAYAHGGSADLGHAVEFRSGLELGYEFADAQRLAVDFYHISNAGLGTKNPGVEVLQLNYSIPLNWWSNK